MPGQVLPDDELILRRFDPTRRDHIYFDEGNGSPRVRQGAFYLRSGEAGLSIARRTVLALRNLPDDAVKEPPRIALAEAETGKIHATGKGWSVVASPWPKGIDHDRPVDEAHALVSSDAPKITDSMLKALTRCFRVICLS